MEVITMENLTKLDESKEKINKLKESQKEEKLRQMPRQPTQLQKK